MCVSLNEEHEFGVPRKNATVTFPPLPGCPCGTHRPWWPECWRRTWRMPGPSWKEKSRSSGPRPRTCWPPEPWRAGARGTRSWRSSHSETPASTLPAPGATSPPSAARWWRKPELRTADRWHKRPRSPSAAAMTSLKNACRPSVMVSQLLIARVRFLPRSFDFWGPSSLNLKPSLPRQPPPTGENGGCVLVPADLKVLQWIRDPGKVTVRSPPPPPPNFSRTGCHQGFCFCFTVKINETSSNFSGKGLKVGF